MERQIIQIESSVQFLKEKVCSIQQRLNQQIQQGITQKIELVFCKLNSQDLYRLLKKQKRKILATLMYNYPIVIVSYLLFLVLTSSLKKVDINTTANLRKLEEYFGGLIMESQFKTSQIQERLIGMITQKEKIIRNLNFQLQNQQHSILAIEQWIKTDHKQNNSIHYVEQNIRKKLDLISKNNQIKTDLLEQKLKYLEQSKQFTFNQLKNFDSFKSEIKENINEIKRQTKEITSKIKLIQDKTPIFENKYDLQKINIQVDKVKNDMQKISQKLMNLDIQIKQINQTEIKMKQKIAKIQNNSIFEQYQQNLQLPRQQEKQRKYSTSSQRKPIIDVNPLSKNILDKTHSKSLQKQISKSQKKKQLPPKKNLFSQQVLLVEEQEPQISMQGGARGLLERAKSRNNLSKSKQEDNIGRSRFAQKKGLPPVRQDTSSKKKKQEQQAKWHQQQEEEQQQQMVYQIDEEGYLMDEDGNYLQDQHGQLVRLSPEQIEQYMQNQEI